MNLNTELKSNKIDIENTDISNTYISELQRINFNNCQLNNDKYNELENDKYNEYCPICHESENNTYHESEVPTCHESENNTYHESEIDINNENNISKVTDSLISINIPNDQTNTTNNKLKIIKHDEKMPKKYVENQQKYQTMLANKYGLSKKKEKEKEPINKIINKNFLDNDNKRRVCINGVFKYVSYNPNNQNNLTPKNEEIKK